MENEKEEMFKEKNRIAKYWHNRTKKEKNIIVAGVFGVVLLLLFSIIFFTISGGSGVCNTSTCVRTSIELLNYMDLKINPCEDFYRFACGNFLLNTNLDNLASWRSIRNIAKDEIQTRIKNILVQSMDNTNDSNGFNLAKRFYRACMNDTEIEIEGLKRIKEIFKHIGGWPALIGNNWRENHFDWKQALYRLKNIGINFEFFFLFSIEREPTNPSRYILYIKDPNYSPARISNEIKSMFLDYMVNISVLFGVPKDQAKRDQYDVMQFILSLAHISEESKAEKHKTISNILSISELQHEYPDIKWFDFINTILSPSTQITYDDVVSVPDPIYIKKLLKLIKSTNKRTIANFISWHTIQYLINYLPVDIQNKAHEYLEKIHGNYKRKPRWNVCVTDVTSRLNPIITTEYIKMYFSDDSREHLLNFIQHIKDQLKINIYQLDWLDEKSKQIIIQKLLTNLVHIPSIDNIYEQYQIYNQIQITEDQLLNFILTLDLIKKNFAFEKLGKLLENRYTDDATFIFGTDVQYLPYENVLKIPFGLIQGMFYQKSHPEYINYGALGSIIAHEMFHIIIEAKYGNFQGKLRSLWSPHSLLNYNQKLDCLSKHYNQFPAPLTEQKLNTSKTKEEDLVDLAGLKLAYDSYLTWINEHGNEPRLPGLKFTANQMFWISSAIAHCTKYSPSALSHFIIKYQTSPGEYRVNGVLQNIYEFSNDFDCLSVSQMNPQNRCAFWSN